MRQLSVLCLVLSFAFISGCGASAAPATSSSPLEAGAEGDSPQLDPNRNTGGDGTWEQAREIPTNRTIIDNVSHRDGDMHDWKLFRVYEPGRVGVRFHCDGLESKTTILLRDDQKIELGQIQCPSESADLWLELEMGGYYLEIVSLEGASDYTFEVMTISQVD